MTLRPLNRAEVRSLDARAADEFGLPTLLLMENAGRGAAEVLRRRAGGVPGRVVIACGPGNNGGDGAVVARHLDAWGSAVTVAWLSPPDRLAADATVHYRILAASGLDQRILDGPDAPSLLADLLTAADWAVDALLGTGLSRPVDGPILGAIAALNTSGLPILALDLPSGLDADTGRPLGDAVRAAATATFVAPKLGFSAPGASAFTGAVEVVEIGLPRILLEPFRAG